MRKVVIWWPLLLLLFHCNGNVDQKKCLRFSQRKGKSEKMTENFEVGVRVLVFLFLILGPIHHVVDLESRWTSYHMV